MDESFFSTNISSQHAALSVSQLNHQAKHLLEVSFSQVWVEGEISNLSKPWSGHWYLTLKDEKSQIKCAMFKGANSRLKWSPTIGDKVIACAKISLYEGRGEYQAIIESLKPAGVGDLQAAFEQLKAKLQNEGLFDPSIKKEIPSHPNHIGVVTSATGAAIHDIISIIRRRCPLQKVTLLPVQVQGNVAAKDIAKAIEKANEFGLFDVLIVGRGGGSIEDLWAFNEEIVVRAIAASTLPVISAVGHETDFTIADFVADYRAPTPSAAAEKVSPDQQEWSLTLDRFQASLTQNIQRQLKFNKDQLEMIAVRLKHPKQSLKDMESRLKENQHRLLNLTTSQLQSKHTRLETLIQRLFISSPVKQLPTLSSKITHLEQRLKSNAEQKVKESRLKFAAQANSLHSVSPLATLGRGFSILSQNKKVVTSIEGLEVGTTLEARLLDGNVECSINSISPISET